MASNVRAGLVLPLPLNSSVTKTPCFTSVSPLNLINKTGGSNGADLIALCKRRYDEYGKGLLAQCLAHSKSSIVSLSLLSSE